MKKKQTILIENILSLHHYIHFYRMYVILKSASYINCTARYIPGYARDIRRQIIYAISASILDFMQCVTGVPGAFFFINIEIFFQGSDFC